MTTAKFILLGFTVIAFSFIFQNVNAQQRLLSGIVVSTEGKGIPSATVQITETNESTTTAEDGRFSIKATRGQHIGISSVGYVSNSMLITNVNDVRIILRASGKELGEVVVTALGISRQKRAVGYSVQDVSGEALSEVKPTNIVNALSGKIAGVQITNATGAVGGSSRIVIRGNHSFGQNEPLWVVDGTPFINFSSDQDAMSGQDYGNGALDLDPSNIESISVLKGANATALYGSRGANGVVLVTTKKGSKARNRIGIDVSSSISFESAYILPNWQNSYGGGSKGSEFYWKKDQPGMTYEDYAKKYSYNYVDGWGGGVNDGISRSWGPRLDAGLLLDQFTGKNQPWVSRPNNMRDFFETGITKDNSIALSKASDAGSMRLFLSNMAVKGTTPNTDYTKYTAGFSSELNLSKRLTAGINMTYVNNHSDNLPSQGYDGGGDNPSASFTFFQRQVDVAPLKDHWSELDAKGHPYSFAQAEMNNPYADAHNNASRTRNRLYGNVNMKYKMTDWLSVLGRIGTDYYNEERKKTLRSISYDGNGSGKFWQSDKFAQETNADILLMFDRKINDQFRLDGTVGANYRIESGHQVRMDINQLTVPDLFTVANISGYPSVSQFDSKKVSNSVLGSFNLSFKNYLFLGVTARNDWSSTLPKNNWSYFYPSVSAGFVFTDAFKMKSDIFSYGKVRGSWAQVGNDAAPYNVGATYSSVGGGSWNGTTMFYLPGQLPSLNLKPENTSSVEAGVDLKFLKNRVGVDLTVYQTKTINQIMSVDIATSTGYSSAFINAGEIENKGVELIVNATPISNPNGFSWDVTVNWAKNKNKVNALYKDLESLFISSMWLSSTEARPGEPYGVIRGSSFLRNKNGDLIVNSRGLPQVAPKVESWGNITPDWIGGVSNSFSYKNFSLSFLIDVRKGGDIISGTKLWATRMGNTAATAANNIRETGLIVPGVKADGTPNDIRVDAQDYFGAASRLPYIMLDGSYVKFRELSLRYALSKSITNRLGIQSASIALFGRNLALLYTDKSNDIHIDPETGFGTGNTGVGYEQMQIPNSRSIGIKLSVSL